MKTRIICVVALLLISVPLFGQATGAAAGGVVAQNQYAPGQLTALGGKVTNPANNFILNVAGGPIYCNGGIETIGQSTITLYASTTFLVVYNCSQRQVYAKTAVTGPGSQTNQPGVPNSVLYPIAGIEQPLATVVCGTTNCGDTSNGSITDGRNVAAFPAGEYVAGHLNQAASGTAGASDIAGTCVLGTSCAITFTQAYNVAPICVATDTTSAAATKSVTSTSGVTFTGTSTDTLDYICIGNPN